METLTSHIYVWIDPAAKAQLGKQNLKIEIAKLAPDLFGYPAARKRLYRIAWKPSKKKWTCNLSFQQCLILSCVNINECEIRTPPKIMEWTLAATVEINHCMDSQSQGADVLLLPPNTSIDLSPTCFAIASEADILHATGLKQPGLDSLPKSFGLQR